MRYRAVLLVASLALSLTACEESNAPGYVVGLRTTLSRREAAPGDTVIIHAILTNGSDKTLKVGTSCGPPVLAEIRQGSAAPLYPVPLDAVFICPLLDVHTLDAGETDTVSIPWRVSVPAGSYTVRSGFRGTAGLERLTAPATLVVR